MKIRKCIIALAVLAAPAYATETSGTGRAYSIDVYAMESDIAPSQISLSITAQKPRLADESTPRYDMGSLPRAKKKAETPGPVVTGYASYAFLDDSMDIENTEAMQGRASALAAKCRMISEEEIHLDRNPKYDHPSAFAAAKNRMISENEIHLETNQKYDYPVAGGMGLRGLVYSTQQPHYKEWDFRAMQLRVLGFSFSALPSDVTDEMSSSEIATAVEAEIKAKLEKLVESQVHVK